MSFKTALQDERALVVGILILGLLLRMIVALTFPPDVVKPDARQYIQSARLLLAGEGYVDVRSSRGGPDLTVPPLYPAFLASVFAVFGPSLVAARLVQGLIAVATCGVVFVMARSVFNRRVALGTLVLCSFYPALVVWSGLLLIETIYALMVSIVFLLLSCFFRRPTWYGALLSGFSLGLSLLTRELLLFFPVLLLPAFLSMKLRLQRAVVYVAMFLVGILVILAPWLWRNYRLTDAVVYTSRVSYLQYRVTGQGYLSPHYAAMVAGQGEPPSSSDLARWDKYGNLAENLDPHFIISHPAIYTRRMYNRFVEYWFHPNGLLSLPDQYCLRRLYTVGHVALVALAMVGIDNMLFCRKWSVWSLVAVLLYITVLNMTTYGPNPRYNLPFLPVVFVFTSSGAIWLAERIGSKARLPS